MKIVYSGQTFAQKTAIIKIEVLGTFSTGNYGVNRCAGNWIHWSPGKSISPPCVVFTNGLTGTNVNYNRVKCTIPGKIDYAYKQNLDQVGIQTLLSIVDWVYSGANYTSSDFILSFTFTDEDPPTKIGENTDSLGWW